MSPTEEILDFKWWKKICSIFNSSASIIARASPVSIVSDASMEGYGAWCGEDWLPDVLDVLDVLDVQWVPEFNPGRKYKHF